MDPRGWSGLIEFHLRIHHIVAADRGSVGVAIRIGYIRPRAVVAFDRDGVTAGCEHRGPDREMRRDDGAIE